jgi:DNA-binding MarR family transcriptional regulator
MHEAPATLRTGAKDDLTAAAGDLLRVMHGLPRHLPSTPARDLTLGQLRLLFMLRHGGPHTMGRIAEIFDLSLTAATGFVGRVERYGLVERRHRSDDRRVVECAVTEVGIQFVDALSGVRLEAAREALAVLTPIELADLRVLLGRIAERGSVAAP